MEERTEGFSQREAAFGLSLVLEAIAHSKDAVDGSVTWKRCC